jgi:hypothetical protein
MTTPLQIIAFTGSAGTGKDTAADILATHCGLDRDHFLPVVRDLKGEPGNVRGLGLKPERATGQGLGQPELTTRGKVFVLGHGRKLPGHK